MSSHSPSPSSSSEATPITVPRFVAAKQRGQKLTVLTAYDHLWAGLLDAAGVDAILVGDTLGMVVQGKPTTLPVTVEEIIYHAEMVVRAVRRALVIADMPFLSYQVSPQEALRNAGEIIKRTGAAAVKLEGGVNQAETIRALTNADIPVMAHVGLKPQSVLKLGGYKIQRDEQRLLADARAAQEAGAFAIVLECIPRRTRLRRAGAGHAGYARAVDVQSAVRQSLCAPAGGRRNGRAELHRRSARRRVSRRRAQPQLIGQGVERVARPQQKKTPVALRARPAVRRLSTPCGAIVAWGVIHFFRSRVTPI
jgi:3-methyl-2-oxobutanoate hydroxymethyltransferase